MEIPKQTFDFKIIEGIENGKAVFYLDLENVFKGKVKVLETDFSTLNTVNYAIDYQGNNSLFFYKSLLQKNDSAFIVDVFTEECRATIVFNKLKVINSQIVCIESL